MTYQLHGRELKVGDKVWSILSETWREITENNLRGVAGCEHAYAWDECTYANTIGAIPPPLGWVEGKPVRKGDVLYAGHNLQVAIMNEAACLMVGLSWSKPKRTEQHWIAFSANGSLCGNPRTEQEAEECRKIGRQVFGPFDVEVS